MKIINLKRLVLCVTLLFSLLLATSCSSSPYDDEWILGKTAEEIIARYGEFDWEAPEDGDYRYEMCGYLTKPARTGPFGTTTEEYYVIYFDAEAIAYKITKNYPRPGG